MARLYRINIHSFNRILQFQIKKAKYLNFLIFFFLLEMLISSMFTAVPIYLFKHRVKIFYTIVKKNLHCIAECIILHSVNMTI